MNIVDMFYDKIRYKEFVPQGELIYSKILEGPYAISTKIASFTPQIGGTVSIDLVLESSGAKVPLTIKRGDEVVVQGVNHPQLNVLPFNKYDIYTAQANIGSGNAIFQIIAGVQDDIDKYFTVGE